MSQSMTIAQSLRRIKKLKGRMGELTARATAAVSFEEGKDPAFPFQTTRDEVAKVRDELVGLESAVARANAVTSIEVDGRKMSIAEAIRRLQELKAEMAWLSQLQLRSGTERRVESDWDETAGHVRRIREVTWKCALKETDRVAELDSLRDRFERINDAVEGANHTTRVEWSAPASARTR